MTSDEHTDLNYSYLSAIVDEIDNNGGLVKITLTNTSDNYDDNEAVFISGGHGLLGTGVYVASDMSILIKDSGYNYKLNDTLILIKKITFL